MEKELFVHVIHGEGDRDTVNALQAHRNKIDHIEGPIDEPPDVVVVLHDQSHKFRIEIPVETWEEVDQWKKLAGWDAEKRRFAHGAVIKVSIG